MKNLKIIFGIALIAAILVIAACGDPEPDPDKTWTVTFDASGGTAVAPQTVQDGGSAVEPYSFLARTTPTAEGLYPASKKATWKNGSNEFVFGVTKVNSDITLKATWADQPAIPSSQLTNPSSGNILEKAHTYINNHADQYILALNSDISNPALTISTPYYQLTIIGLSSEKTITLTGTGSLFTIGVASGSVSTIALSIGNNIALAGVTDNKNPLVFVRNGASFNMSGTSKITGNTSDGTAYVSETNNAGYGAAAVHVDGATFNMSGGSITGNTNNRTTDKISSAGAVYVEARGTINLSGNAQINSNTNSGGTADVYVTQTSNIYFSGTATVGQVGLTFSGTTFGKITVNPDMSSTSGGATINLKGTATNWLNKPILQGATAAQTARFSTGNFLDTTSVVISNTHKISNTGSNIGTLIAN